MTDSGLECETGKDVTSNEIKEAMDRFKKDGGVIKKVEDD